MAVQSVAVMLNVLLLSLPCDFLLERKTMKIDRLVLCPGWKNMTILYDHIVFNHIKTYLSVNIRMTVKQDTTSGVRLKMVMARCKSKEALDTCEPYPDIVFSNLCFVITTKMPPFRGSLEQIVPPLPCPIKKGVYQMTNGTMDEASLSLLPFDNYYFKIHVYMLDKFDGEYKTISCSYFEGQLINL